MTYTVNGNEQPQIKWSHGEEGELCSRFGQLRGVTSPLLVEAYLRSPSTLFLRTR